MDQLTEEEIEWLKLLLKEDILRYKNAIQFCSPANKESYEYLGNEMIKMENSILEKLSRSK